MLVVGQSGGGSARNAYSSTNSQIWFKPLRQKISLANGGKGASLSPLVVPPALLRMLYGTMHTTHTSSHLTENNNTRTKHIIFFTSITSNDIMYVVKRDGKQQTVQFDKIQSRISKLCYGLDQKVRMILVVVLVDLQTASRPWTGRSTLKMMCTITRESILESLLTPRHPSPSISPSSNSPPLFTPSSPPPSSPLYSTLTITLSPKGGIKKNCFRGT